MGPKRVIGPEERERRRRYQAAYRERRAEDPAWREAEVQRTRVSYKLCLNLYIIYYWS